jgi:GntR family transcriptional regulator
VRNTPPEPGNEQNSPLPIYWRVYSVLREEIADREYPTTEPLPSESAIAERFSTSRITVRKAIEMLRSEGYLFTRRGIGTFVSPKLPAEATPQSFTANLTAMWRQTKTELLEFGMVPAPAHVAALLRVEAGDDVHKSIRLRNYKKRPIGLLTTFIQKQLAQNFSREDFVSEPLFRLFAQAGSPSVTARQRVTARSADPYSAQHLNVEIGAPLLCMMRVSYSTNGAPISYLKALFRPDRYEIELDLEVSTASQTAVWHLPGKDGYSSRHTALFDLDAPET